MGLEDCRLQCERQQSLYDGWDDQDLQTAFSDHKRCVLEEECDAIDEGACYDSDLFAW